MNRFLKRGYAGWWWVGAGSCLAGLISGILLLWQLNPSWQEQAGAAVRRGTTIWPVPLPLSEEDSESRRLLAYEMDGDIWVTDYEHKVRGQVTSSGQNFQPSWCPDGRRLLFVTSSGSSPDSPLWLGGDLRVAEVGERTATLWSRGGVSEPQCSAGGDEVVYVHKGIGLRTLNLASGTGQTLLQGQSERPVWSPRWLSDGRVLFVKLEESWSGVDDRLDNLWIVDSSGEQSKLTDFEVPRADMEPYAWSIIRTPAVNEAAGTVLFVRAWHDQNELAAPHFELWETSLEGGSPQMVRDLPREVYVVGIGQNGEHLVYKVPDMEVSRPQGPGFQVYLGGLRSPASGNLGQRLLTGVGSASWLDAQ